MKKLFILQVLTALLVLLTFSAQARPNIYKLSKPVIYPNGDTLWYIHWFVLRYPESNTAYWGLRKDSVAEDRMYGNHEIPQTVIDAWGTDDSVIPKHFEKVKVWAIKED